jgi:ferric-dicitrate binding protein FerR (iron transport regulator)
MALSCRNAARISLATLAGHAAEAERLELEEHLSSCSRCGEDHESLTWVRHLRSYQPDPLSSGARDNIRRALFARTVNPATPRRRLVWPVALACAGLMVAVAVGLTTLARQPYRLLGGDVVAASANPKDASAPVRFQATAGGRVSLGMAVADLARNTELSWVRSKQVLTLVHGTVTVDVQHQNGRHFEVRAHGFTVEVVGTRFTVEATGVTTERGVVRVLGPDGQLLRRLGAGESWHQEPANEGHQVELLQPAIAPVPVAVRSGSAGDLAGARAKDAAVSLAARLNQARHALATGDPGLARRLVSPLFRQSHNTAVEARVLFAESFLVEGRYADAIDAYRLVARDFPRSDQAETSLFTIAQLQCEHGAGPDARGALRTYLIRYPHGRYAREAGERLSRLSSVD